MTAHEPEYSKETIPFADILWGDGFISPGWPGRGILDAG